MKNRKPKITKRKDVKKFEQSETVVPSPRWVQRRMWRNLNVAAACDINLQRKKRAEELLTTVRVKSDIETAKPQCRPDARQSQINTAPTSENIPRQAKRHVMKSAGNRFKRVIKAVRSIVKQTVYLRVAHSRLPCSGKDNDTWRN